LATRNQVMWDRRRQGESKGVIGSRGGVPQKRRGGHLNILGGNKRTGRGTPQETRRAEA